MGRRLSFTDHDDVENNYISEEKDFGFRELIHMITESEAFPQNDEYFFSVIGVCHCDSVVG